MATIVYVANTNVIELIGLKSAIEDEYVNDADVLLTTVRDSDGVEVSGQSFPWTMDYVADSNGDYRGILQDGLEIENGKTYTAIIDVDAGPDRIGHWEFPFTPKTRTKA